MQERARLQDFIRPKIMDALGSQLPYHKVFDPFADSKAITTTLSDDLQDIYCDTKEGLLAVVAAERITASVVWTWKFGLESHWGRHAVSAIDALHCLRFHAE